jgi:hypothetical protein
MGNTQKEPEVVELSSVQVLDSLFMLTEARIKQIPLYLGMRACNRGRQLLKDGARPTARAPRLGRLASTHWYCS